MISNLAKTGAVRNDTRESSRDDLFFCRATLGEDEPVIISYEPANLKN
jgi:hypothetical protein